MKRTSLLLLLFVNIFCFSQSTIEGFIFDENTNESLPYATVKLLSSSNNYTITNEDGKFEIKSLHSNDSLEVRYIGYITKKIPLDYFKNQTTLFLSPNIFSLNEVSVIAKKDKNYSYKLLNSLILKYRNKHLVTESKAFLTLTSSSKGIPIEIIEGFYNSKQSLSDGIIDLKIKSGRFGQNKSFPFYSLSNTQVLKDFQFFKTSNQILPFYPGNMTIDEIKRKYTIKIDECNSCNPEDLSISFIPKKFNGHLFFGKIIFNKNKLAIKKIELDINDPITNGLSSIIKNDIMTPKQIKLVINFNLADYEKIQSLSLDFTMYYKSEEALQIIQSKSFLYCYDYNQSFEEPYFTNNIHFNSDYDKITALPASDDFWKLNYQFPKSFNEIKSINFFEKSGYLINYENTIPPVDIKNTNPSVILWNKNNRLEWESIKYDLNGDKNEHNYTDRDNNGTNIIANKVFYSIAELRKNNKNSGSDQELNFCYILDTYKNKNGEKQFITRTIFDRNSSSYRYDRTKNKLIYINLIFDIYEYYKQKLNSEIDNNMNFNVVKDKCKDKFQEATLIVEKMKNETNSGLNFQSLVKWNNIIKTKLNIDNFSLIVNQE